MTNFGSIHWDHRVHPLCIMLFRIEHCVTKRMTSHLVLSQASILVTGVTSLITHKAVIWHVPIVTSKRSPSFSVQGTFQHPSLNSSHLGSISRNEKLTWLVGTGLLVVHRHLPTFPLLWLGVTPAAVSLIFRWLGDWGLGTRRVLHPGNAPAVGLKSQWI